jgi:hypothetical protein
MIKHFVWRVYGDNVISVSVDTEAGFLVATNESGRILIKRTGLTRKEILFLLDNFFQFNEARR